MSTVATGRENNSARKQARQLVADLLQPRPLIYWTDLLLTLTVGYAGASLYLNAPLEMWQRLVILPIAGFALLRAANFIHEISHFRKGEMVPFVVGWNILCGIGMLLPSFFYEKHLDHHRTDSYGTEHDGEYLPLATQPVSHIFAFLVQAFLLPVYIFIRFLITPLTYLHPSLRRLVIERMSSFVINFRYRRDMPENIPWWWIAMEWMCFARTLALVVPICLGYFVWTRVFVLYSLAAFVLGLNHIRSLVAHHYRSGGDQMSYDEQIDDSVTVTGHPFFTELIFPLGLRYHTLHHMFPSLPYHNLGVAHRRLMAELPEDAPYRRTVYSSVWSVLRILWADARSPHPPKPAPVLPR